MTELEASGGVENPPPYIIFVVVFLFFLTGLLGFLICHLLKKKGYRCRTGDMDDDEEEGEKLGEKTDDDDDENQDTVEQILKCIIENEANMEAFNEMLGNRNVCVRHDPRLRKESIGGIPPHHHTVHSGTDHNSCHLCAQGRSKKGRRQSRTPRSKRPGEQTVFSVGRFRVTHNDKKLHGGPNPLVNSGDQLDQSQDLDDRKEGGYNLRSMFKDVRPPSENSNGVGPNVGKRRKSLTIFGLRRGSDPVGVKAGEGLGRETGGVRFAIQQQPVVLEELSQTESKEVAPEAGTKPGIKLETETSKNQRSPSPQVQAKTSDPVNSQSVQSGNQTQVISCPTEDGSKHGSSPEPHTNHMNKPSGGNIAASAPSSLPIPTLSSSVQTFTTTQKQGDHKDRALENKDAYDPGPLQTSTPIAPMYGSIPGYSMVNPTSQPEPYSSSDFPVTQTPPDPSYSPDLEPGFRASLAFISLGSSPPSSAPVKTPSSVSSLTTPTPPLDITPSPRLSSRNTPSEAGKTAFSPVLTPSPKLPSGREMSSQSPTPPRLTLKSGSVTSVTSMTKGDMVSSQTSPKEQEQEGGNVPVTEEKTEIKRAGILKTATLSPAETSKAFAVSSPTDLLSKERLSSTPLSPPSPLTPTSPLGSRVSSMTIVKASPDSKREFSVVTMVREEESSTSVKDQKGQTPKLTTESEKVGVNPTVGPSVEQPITQSEETSGAAERPTVSQEKDDMVEMEDIKDCKVMQVEKAERKNEVQEKQD